jgi:hypothetical protein
MVRPLLVAEPGPGDASCTIWTLSVSFNPLHSQAGRPSSRFAFSSFPIFRSSPVFPPIPTLRSSPVSQLLPIFRFSPAFQPLPISWSSPVSRPLPTFRFSPVLRLLSSFRSSPILRLLPTFPSSPIFRSFPISRSSPVFQPLPIFRSSPASDRSVLSAIPTFRLVGICLTGDSSYSRKLRLSKPKEGYLEWFSNHKHQ